MFDNDCFDLNVFDKRDVPVFSDVLFDDVLFDTENRSLVLQAFVTNTWVPGVLKRWNGSSWVPSDLKLRLGNSWVTVL